MVGCQLRHNFDNLSLSEILEMKKLCISFGIKPSCSKMEHSSDELIIFDFGMDVKRRDVFRKGIVRILDRCIDLGNGKRCDDYTHGVSCPWIRTKI